MTVELIPFLILTGQSTVQRIQHNLAATGTDASMKTSRSLRFEVQEEGTIAHLRIIGRPYFMTVETGRKPTPQYTKPSKDFVRRIKDWLQFVSGITGPAYAIALSIHKKGTKLWRDGGRKDIVSNVVNQTLYDQISK